ncbi:unnamed protein product [Cunninghamella echinulata]
MTFTKKLLVINPNTNKEMTQVIETSVNQTISLYKGIISADTICVDHGVASVEGSFDEIVSAYWTLEKVIPLLDQYDGILVACFSNHASVKALREYTQKPIMHIMEAAILHSLPLGHQFSIITDSTHWKPLLEEGVSSILGNMEKCASVRSSGMTALDTVSLSKDIIEQKIVKQSELAIQEDGAEIILLGCAGLSFIQGIIEKKLNIPVVDAVQTGVLFMSGLLLSNAKTSPVGMYTPLPPRPTEVSVPNSGIMLAYNPKNKK